LESHARTKSNGRNTYKITCYGNIKNMMNKQVAQKIMSTHEHKRNERRKPGGIFIRKIR
jgi:hypothetical protein